MNNERNEHKQVASCFPEERLLQWHQQYKAILALGRDINPPILPPSDAPKKRSRYFVEVFSTIINAFLQ